jgi:hypothetical protein
LGFAGTVLLLGSDAGAQARARNPVPQRPVHWVTLTPRLAKAGLIPDDPKLIQRIVNLGTGK